MRLLWSDGNGGRGLLVERQTVGFGLLGGACELVARRPKVDFWMGETVTGDDWRRSLD